MRLHERPCDPAGRLLLCERVREEGWPVVDAAAATGCSERTAYKWLRQLRMTSTRIAQTLTMATSTVCAVLARLGLGHFSRLDPPRSRPIATAGAHPGELIHTD